MQWKSVCVSLCSSFAWFIKSQTGFHSRGRSKEVRVQMYFSVCFTLQTWLCPVAFTRLDSTLETRHFKSNGFNATSHSTPTRHLETFCSFPLQTLLNGAYTEDAPWCQFLWLPWRLDLKSVALRGQNKMEPTHCCNIIYRWPCDQAQLRQLLHHKTGSLNMYMFMHPYRCYSWAQGEVLLSHHRCCCGMQ